jgi:hypothetical protein
MPVFALSAPARSSDTCTDSDAEAGFYVCRPPDGTPPNAISGTTFFEQAKASPVRGVAV